MKYTRDIAALGLSAMALSTGISDIPAAESKPNVLMIILDDMNDYIGVMGGHQQTLTPHIDRFAKQGVYFANAHSNCPVCSPSRASFMSGIAPWHSGCWGFKNPLQNPVLKASKTIAQYARENGYTTAETGKVLHIDIPSIWDDRGIPKSHGPYASDGVKMVQHPACPATMAKFGALDSTFAPLSDIPVVKTTDGRIVKGWFDIHWGQKPRPFRYVTDDNRDKMTDEKSVEWFRKKIAGFQHHGLNKPFFIAVGIMRPHTPLVVPKKYFDKFPLDKIKLPVRQENDKADCGKYVREHKSRGQLIYEALKAGYPTTEEGLKRYTQAYLACVNFADDMVGQILQTLDSSKFRDNTIVILFSDHGYHVGEKDELWKYTNWEESTRVPFIIRDPRYARNAGKRVDHAISLIDVFPTIQDLCGMTGTTRINKNGAPLSGHSLRPFLENPQTTQWEGPDIAVTITASWKSTLPRQQNLSARSRYFCYIHYADGSEELYDHRNDPHEWHNLANDPRYTSIKAELKQKLWKVVPEEIRKTATAIQSGKTTQAKSAAEAWKDKFFKLHPEADTNHDGVLSWPEYHAYKRREKEGKR